MKAHKIELIARNNFPRSWVNTEDIKETKYPRKWLEDLSLAEQEALGWYDITDNLPVIAVNERADKLPLVFTGSTIEQNYTVVEILPLQDYLDLQDKNNDNAEIQQSIESLAIVLVELGKSLQSDGLIDPSTFPSPVKTAFQNLTVVVDRVVARR